MNYYPHHISDFNNATRHLTRVERSVYRDAIELYYDTEQALTGDVSKLERRLLCHSDEEKTALKDVLAEFFEKVEDGFFHERCDFEIEKYKANNSAKARAGKASAEARKRKAKEKKEQKSTGVEQVLNTSSTEREQNSTNQEPRTKNQEPIINIPPEKPAPKKQKRKSRLPDDFTLNAERGRKAIDYWREKNREDLISQVADTFDQFCAHHRAKGSTMACWDSAWQTWYCNATKFNRPTGGQPNGHNQNQPRRLSAVERVQQNCEEARRKREAQQRTEAGGFTFDGEVVAEDGESLRLQVHQPIW